MCDKNCQLFKGFSLCSHIIATAHTNGDLKVFLDKVNGKCKPNLTAIANHGMPSGTGRKGGVAKQKRNRKLPAIETRSVRPCLDTNEKTIIVGTSAPSSGREQPDCPTLPPQLLSTASNSPLLSSSPILSNASSSPLLSNASSSPLLSNASSSPRLNAGAITLPHSMPSNLQSMLRGTCTPSVTSISVVNDLRPCISTVNASSHGQVFVGTNVNCSRAQLADLNSKKPFILKFKTNSIKICQSCQRNYEDPNNTMGLVARAERRLVLNLATGTQFLGRESNSHYHLHLACLRAADSTFTGDQDLVIPDEVKIKLNNFQNVYLIYCFKASVWLHQFKS